MWLIFFERSEVENLSPPKFFVPRQNFKEIWAGEKFGRGKKII